MATITKTGRISVRVPHNATATLHQAAALSGTTLDSFLLQAALKEARRVIEHNEESRRDPDTPALLLNFSISRMGPRRR